MPARPGKQHLMALRTCSGQPIPYSCDCRNHRKSYLSLWDPLQLGVPSRSVNLLPPGKVTRMQAGKILGFNCPKTLCSHRVGLFWPISVSQLHLLVSILSNRVRAHTCFCWQKTDRYFRTRGERKNMSVHFRTVKKVIKAGVAPFSDHGTTHSL